MSWISVSIWLRKVMKSGFNLSLKMHSQLWLISFWTFVFLHFNGCRSEGSEIPLPLQCAKDDDCILNSSCIENKCQCNDGYIFSGDMTNCLGVARSYGDECEESLQCSAYLAAGGTCEDGKCTCAKGYHYLHGYCYLSAELGESCSSSDNCYIGFDINAGTCEKAKCRCSNNFYQREYRSCRPAAQKIGDECAIDLDCRLHDRVTCDKSKTCQLGHNGRRVLLQDESVILDNAANVSASFRKIGKACNSTDEACFCERGYFPMEDKCVAEIGEPCTAEESAKIKNSRCRNGRWTCKVTHVASIDNRECKKITPKYNNSCQVKEQCTVFGTDAVCLNRRCVCNDKSHYVEKELFCWMNKALGESCKRNEDCYVTGLDVNLHCNDKFVCSCPDGYHIGADEKTCIKDDTSLGDVCTEDKDCTVKYSICNEKLCTCAENYFQSSGKCFKGISAQCQFDNECNATRSHCNNNQCTCAEGYIVHSVGLCVPVVSFGKVCDYDIQCTAKHDNSICRAIEEISDNKLHNEQVKNKTCTCIDGYHYNYGECYKKRVLREPCRNIAECYVQSNSNSILCKNDICSCNFGWSQVNNSYCKENNASDITFNYMWILLIISSALYIKPI